MAPHSSTLAWKIPWAEEPGRLQSMGSQRVGYDWATSLSLFTFHFYALEKEMAIHSSVLAWRIPGTGEPGGLWSMGSYRVGHDWSDLAAAAAAAAAVCICQSQSFKLYHHPFFLFVSIHLFSMSVSISALQISSSVSFLWVPHISDIIQNLFFSFWLTSLCMTDSRSIHISANGTIFFLFVAE